MAQVRFVGCVLSGVFAIAGLAAGVACSSDADDTKAGALAPDASIGETGTTNDGGAADANIGDDSGDAGCGTKPDYPSNSCQVNDACNSTECGVPGVKYVCLASGNGQMAPITGCRDLGDAGTGASGWCCPAQCVRDAVHDTNNCKLTQCPTLGGLTATPAPGCTFSFDGGTYASYCCP